MRLKKALIAAPVAVVVLYGLLWVVPPTAVVDSQFHRNHFDVMAHGAGRGLVPGNTLEAAQYSWSLGADAIEIDIHLTADNRVVLRHDAIIDTTTDGSGAIAEMTFAELQTFNVGFHDRDNRFTDLPSTLPQYDQLKIPALDHVLAAMPTARFMIEIKPDTAAAAQQLCAVIEQQQAAQRVMVGSFHDDALNAFRAACPQVETSLATEEVRRLITLTQFGLGHRFISAGVSMQLPVKLGDRVLVTPQLLEVADRLGLSVNVWTINDEEEMARLIAMGVQGIITDRPDRLLALLAEP